MVISKKNKSAFAILAHKQVANLQTGQLVGNKPPKTSQITCKVQQQQQQQQMPM